MTFRQREVAVRAAIGASPSRLVRQFLAESLLLALTGGLAGLLLAWWMLKRLVASAAPYLPRAHEVGLDWRVFAFMLGVCVLVGTAVGAAAGDHRGAPRSARSAAGRGRPRARWGRRSAGCATVSSSRRSRSRSCSASAPSVLLRELVRLRATDAGLVPQNVITFHVGRPAQCAGRRRCGFYDIADRVAALPGVQAAGFAQMLPLQSWGWTSNSTDFRVRGRPARAAEFPIELRYVTPGYFEALGIPIRRGRGFTPVDAPGALPVDHHQRGAGAARVPRRGSRSGCSRRAGRSSASIADVRQAHLDQPAAPEVYYPVAQNWSQVSELGMTLVVRTRERPEPLIDAVRSAIRDVDPDQAMFGIKTMDGVVAESLSGFTLSLSILSAFAGLAIVLALSGTYGVISYLASSRAREFAIRVALGAGRARVDPLGARPGTDADGARPGDRRRRRARGRGAARQIAPIAVRRPDLLTLVPVALRDRDRRGDRGAGAGAPRVARRSDGRAACRLATFR